MASELMGAFGRMMNEIENASARAVEQAGEFAEFEIKDIIQEEVYQRYSPKKYDRTGAMGEAPKMVFLTNDRFIVMIRDMGNWESVNETPFYAPFGLEGGYTWGRPATNIMREIVSFRFQNDIANEYQNAMRSQGIPIRRK